VSGPGAIRIRLLSRLAVRDLRHGWRSTACLIVAVMVALVPLLLLFGLKFGVVTNLVDALRADPRVREIRLQRDLPLTQAWFDALRADPRVGFALPRARYLASQVRMRGPDGRRRLEVRMIPTAPGDPFLDGVAIPEGADQIVLTSRAALEVGARVGDTVTLDVVRIVGDDREAVRRELTVVGEVPRDRLQSDDVFLSPMLESAIERWREGFAVPALGWEAAPGTRAEQESGRQLAGFRLFARDVRDVPGLRDRLLADGLDVKTRASEIERILAIEAGLGWVFVALTTLSAGGFLLTLGLHLAASVVEKARELAILRLLGLRRAELAFMPSLQGAVIAGLGALGACAAAGLAQPVVNARLSGLAGLTGEVSRLDPEHFLAAAAAAATSGALAGSVAGLRAAALEPTQGLRRD
jgi:putative ABC transport system permease protein